MDFGVFYRRNEKENATAQKCHIERETRRRPSERRKKDK